MSRARKRKTPEIAPFETDLEDGSDFHAEDLIERPFDRGLARRLFGYVGPHRSLVVGSLLIILVSTLLSLVGPILVMEAIDGPLAAGGDGGDSLSWASALLAEIGAAFTLEPLVSGAPQELRIEWLYLVVGIYAALVAVQFFLRFLETIVMSLTGQKVMFDLRQELFAHLQKQEVSFFHRNPVGRLVTRITSDIEALNELFSSGFVTLIGDFVSIAGIVVMLFWANAELALLALAVTPLLFVASLIFRKMARRNYREVRRRISHLNAYTQESITGMEVIQATRREDHQAERYGEINATLRDAHLRSIFWYAIFFPFVEILATITLGVIVVKGGAQISAGTATFGEFFLFWTYLTRFFTPVRDLAEKYNLLQAAMAASERVFNLLDSDETLAVSARPQERRLLNDAIRFESVSFSYDGETPVLEEVSFSVKKGETVAIVGATGAGKSTVINLLLRFYDPDEGRITIDGIDVRDFALAEHRSRFGLVLQDVAVLSRSLAENVAFDREISRQRLAWALSQVNADRIVERAPGGLDEVMKERGRTLSSGERQLLSFARALAGDPEVLVLDEATSHIDSETEALIQDALGKLTEGRTSVVIAHRLSTVRNADRILVFHHGRLREEGRHRQLMEQDGIYARLYRLQFGGDGAGGSK